MNTTLHVAFFWHMHQPTYLNPETGSVDMPWVRLHGARDYTDMARVMHLAPSARATINWVPGLLDQLAELGTPDHGQRERFWRLSTTDPDALTPAERGFLEGHFFSLPDATMLAPHPRYRELRDLVRAGRRLGRQELVDLQVWFNLAWCGAAVSAQPEVAALLARGRDFQPADREVVLRAQQRAGVAVEQTWTRLAADPRVELTLSPYYHPILPLLTDTMSARESLPASPLPSTRYRRPGDAVTQILKAVGPERRHFIDEAGARVPIRGMWPSEGSVSEPVLSMLADAGIQWIVTDETLVHRALAETHARDALAHLRPWRRGPLRVVFRDHTLSDRIGFVYAAWDRRAAWADFVTHLQRLRARLVAAGERDGLVIVALDGENCWEHYDGGITAFLPGLYDAIQAADGLALATVSEAIAAVEASRGDATELPPVAAGSWIDGTFRTWIGDPVKNRAWDLLAAAREAADAALSRLPAIPAADAERLEQLVLRAEASDWWWWFGEGHSTQYDGHFDALFRAHLRAIWRLVGEGVPPELSRSVYETGADDVPEPSSPDDAAHDERPRAHFRVNTDGDDSWYYKWVGAGHVAPRFGAIHRAEATCTGLDYTRDDEAIHLRLRIGSRDDFEARLGAGLRVVMYVERGHGTPLRVLLATPTVVARDAELIARAHHEATFEASVPLVGICPAPFEGRLRCWFEIQQHLTGDGYAPIERFPAEGVAQLVLDPPALA